MRTHRSLRALLVLSALGLVLAACAPSAPSPTAAPPKPAEAKPTAAPTQAPAKPAEAKPAVAPTQAAAAATQAPAKPAATAPAAAKPTQPAPVVMSAAIPPNMNSIPMFLGVEKGIFFKHGVDLKIKPFSVGSELAKSVQTDDTQFTSQSFSNLLPALDQGLPFVALATTFGDATTTTSDRQMSITARPGSGIKTVEDLVGKKIGLVTSGSADEYLKAVLAKHKIPLDKVQLLNVPTSNQVSALQAGQIDATVVTEPFSTMALETVKDSYTVLRGGGFIAYSGFLVTRPDVIKNRPEVVQRVIDAWVEATWATRQNPAAGGEAATRWITGLEAPIAAKALKFTDFDPRISKSMFEVLETHNKLLIEQKKIKQPIDLKNVMNTTFLEKAVKEHPEWIADLKAAN